MKRLIILALFLLVISDVHAVCNSTQIDINSASAEELDKIIYIGNSTAIKIIASRPFSSIEDLLNVSGIGPAKLEKIKAEGLACISGEEQSSENEEEDNQISSGQEDNIEKNNSDKEISENFPEKTAEKKNISPIILNAKTIKSNDNKESWKENLALYGIIAFCIVFGALFLLNRRKYKNEFQ